MVILKGMAKETSDFKNMVSRGGIPECKYYGYTSVIRKGTILNKTANQNRGYISHEEKREIVMTVKQD